MNKSDIVLLTQVKTELDAADTIIEQYEELHRKHGGPDRNFTNRKMAREDITIQFMNWLKTQTPTPYAFRGTWPDGRTGSEPVQGVAQALENGFQITKALFEP